MQGESSKNLRLPSEYVLPNAIQESPDLVDRVTSNWKDMAINNTNDVQVLGFLVIAAQLVLGFG